MPRYYFSVAGGKPFDDVDGLELPDIVAAHAEALGFARDLMRIDCDRRDWAGWSVVVTDDDHQAVLDLPFVDAADRDDDGG